MASFEDQKRIKKLGEEEELIDALGHENEKEGIKNVKEFMKGEEKKEQDKQDRMTELIMGASKGNKNSYILFMAELLDRKLKSVSISPGWIYEIIPTGEGVILELISPLKRYFRRAFKPCGQAIYDLNAINQYGDAVETTIDKVNKELLETNGRDKQGSLNTKDN
jgi:hypothetical protein